VSLDPEAARRLAGAGATLLLLDVPHGTLLGLDQQVFTVGPRFKGVKMVPPGVHMLSYQATDLRGGASPAVSTFLALGPREVVVRRWSPADEGLAPLADEEEVGRGSMLAAGGEGQNTPSLVPDRAIHLAAAQAARYAEGARRFDFDSGLAPYDLAAWPAWRELTSFVDAALLKRLLPVRGRARYSSQSACCWACVMPPHSSTLQAAAPDSQRAPPAGWR
jgi:A1 cistron-splicing factor AAR2